LRSSDQERTEALKIIQHAGGGAAVVLAVALSAAALAACGASSSSSGGSTTTRTTASASSRQAQLAACLKQHGVKLPAGFGHFRPGSRPSGGAPGGGAPGAGTTPGAGAAPGTGTGPGGGARPGGGFFGRPGARNSKFGAAFRSCGAKLGFRGGGPGGRPGGSFGLNRAAVDKFVACVRKHGYDLPKPNFSRGSGGIFPSNIRTNKKFVAASRSCTKLLVRPAPASTTSSS
jgi:hypothetical protein